jgi:hypothetical protein
METDVTDASELSIVEGATRVDLLRLSGHLLCFRVHNNTYHIVWRADSFSPYLHWPDILFTCPHCDREGNWDHLRRKSRLFDLFSNQAVPEDVHIDWEEIKEEGDKLYGCVDAETFAEAIAQKTTCRNLAQRAQNVQFHRFSAHYGSQHISSFF